MIDRLARSGAYVWVPVLLAGVVALGAAPLTAEHRPPIPAGQGSATVYSYTLTLDSPYAPPGDRPSLAAYWLAAGVGTFVLSGVVVAMARRRLGRRLRPWAWGVLLLLLLIGFWAVSPSLTVLLHLPRSAAASIGDLTIRGNQALLVVAAGLVVLGGVERRWGLVGFAVAFAGVALLANLYDLENQIPTAVLPVDSSLFQSSEEVNVIFAGVVLVLGAGAGITWSLLRHRPDPERAGP